MSAISYGLELLKHGLIWRIGDGRSVRIWQDNWLMRTDELKVIGPKGQSRLNWVSSLLNGDGKWDETLVYRTFLPIDAEVILRIKTSSSLPEDMVACQYERSSIFLVKSAYRVGLQLAQQDWMTAASSLVPLGDKPICKTI
jgi:hypothetical protein